MIIFHGHRPNFQDDNSSIVLYLAVFEVFTCFLEYDLDIGWHVRARTESKFRKFTFP